MTTRLERMKMQRRMKRRIQLVVEERRMAMAFTLRETTTSGETTIEIRPRAIGRVSVPRA